jgi:ABC-type nitrate/sulfonate/bicarbonate transport system permease component
MDMLYLVEAVLGFAIGSWLAFVVGTKLYGLIFEDLESPEVLFWFPLTPLGWIPLILSSGVRNLVFGQESIDPHNFIVLGATYFVWTLGSLSLGPRKNANKRNLKL